MNPRLTATAAGALISWQGLAWAAQPVAPAADHASTTSAEASDAWGNSPAAQSAVRLAQPPDQPAVKAEQPSGAKAIARQRTQHAPTSPATTHHPTGVPQAGGLACTDLPARWDRAQARASAGQTAQAYADYLELLHACSDPGALTGTAWKAARALPSADVDRLLSDPVFDKPSLQPVRTDLRLQRMYSENEAGHDASALTYSRALRADPSVHLDASALEISGWLEERAGDDNAAEALFRQALLTAKDSSPARLGLALSLMHQRRLVEAEAQSRELTTQQGKRLHAAIELALAKNSHDSAQVDAALKEIDEAGDGTEPATRALAAWALMNSGRPTQAERIFSKLHETAPENDEYIQGLVFAAAANRDYQTLDTLLNEPPGKLPPLVRQTLAAHDERLGLYDRARALMGHPSEAQEPSLQSLFTLDRKSGTAGQDKLTVWTIPQLSISMLVSPSLTVRVEGTVLRLDDGVQHVWGRQLGALVRAEVGQGVLFAGAALEKPGERPVQILGKVQYQRIAESEDEFVRVTFSRDSIYDSLRAFEGAASSGTGPAISSSVELAARQAIERSAFHIGEALSGGAVTATGTAVDPFYAVSLSLTRDFSAKG